MDKWSNNKKYALHIEPTNVCNSACPNCPRYVAGSRLERPGLVHTSISIEQYMEWFPPDLLKNRCGRIMLCGNQGDPAATPDIVPIVEYTLKHLNKDALFVMHSNAGLRSKFIWKELGKLIQGRPGWFMLFSIDGLEDTNHIYRRNVQWQRVMDNAKAFLSNGGNAYWDFLVFKHNEHQIDEVKKLAKDMGFIDTRIKLPDGMYWHDELHHVGVYDREGNLEYTIRASDIPELQNAPAGTKLSTHMPAQKIQLLNLNYLRNDEEYALYEDHIIKCKSLVSEDLGAELYITHEGLVLPCCYIGELWQSQRTDAAYLQLQDMFDIDYMNLKNNTIDAITEYFDALLIPSWTKENYKCGKTKYCSKICGQNSSMSRLIYKDTDTNVD